MSRAAEDGLALLEAAQQIHAERHGPHTFLPGTYLSTLEAAKRTGIRSDRQRCYDAIDDLEYEGAIEWDKSARYARGDKTLPHHPAWPEDAAGTPLEAELPVV